MREKMMRSVFSPYVVARCPAVAMGVENLGQGHKFVIMEPPKKKQRAERKEWTESDFDNAVVIICANDLPYAV